MKHSSIRVMLVMVAMFDLELEQLDVKTTFLHGELEEQIYMQAMRGFCDSMRKRPCVPIEKVFVWTRASPQGRWYKRFDAFMLEHDFLRSRV